MGKGAGETLPYKPTSSCSHRVQAEGCYPCSPRQQVWGPGPPTSPTQMHFRGRESVGPASSTLPRTLALALQPGSELALLLLVLLPGVGVRRAPSQGLRPGFQSHLLSWGAWAWSWSLSGPPSSSWGARPYRQVPRPLARGRALHRQPPSFFRCTSSGANTPQLEAEDQDRITELP